MIWPAHALQAQNHDVKVILPKDRGHSLRAEVTTSGKVIKAHWPKDADVIVLQRVTHCQLIDAIKLMTPHVAVVIDMDDDLATVDPNNPAWHAMHPTRGYDSNHSWLNTQQACNVASLVTVSADALLTRYARHGRGVVLHNCVPERYLKIEHHDSDVLGWGGALHVHPNDIQVLGSTIALLTAGGTRFRVVGPGDGVAHALRCADDAIESTGTRDLQTEWPEALTTLGIGIAPLANTRFNTSKSWLKLLEYSALGVPWVASPRAEYQRAHVLSGAGFLVEKPKHWLRRTRELLSNDSLRREMSEAGRVWAATQTIEGNAWRWAEAWKQATYNVK